MTADFGARLHINTELAPFVFAVSGHNLFGNLKFVSQESPLPRFFRLSAATRPWSPVILAAELLLANDDRPAFGLGGEYRLRLKNKWAVNGRLGYNSFGSSDELEDLSGISIGTGVTVDRLTFDYAWLPFGLLGDTHRLTLGFRF